MNNLRLAACLLTLLLQFVGCTTMPKISLEEKLLATIPESFEVEWGRNRPVFSPDGARVAYVASQGDNERRDIARKYFVVVGSDKGQDYKQIQGDPVFSPDGSKLAYSVHQNGKGFIVVRDSGGIETKGPEFDSVATWDPVVSFSRDGKMTYSANQGGRWFVVNGEKREADSGFLAIMYTASSPDGKRIAYSATPQQDQQFVAVDGKPGPIFHDVQHPVFSPDGSKVAYPARHVRGGSWIAFLVIGDKRGPEFKSVTQPIFSPDGNKVAYVASSLSIGKTFVMIGDEKGEEFEDVRDPAFSPDGRQVAYAADLRDGPRYGMWAVVAGNKKGPQFDGVYQPMFSSDGRKVAYGARKGKELWWKVMDAQ